MQRLARKPGVWGTIVGIAVLVLLSVLGIIPLDVARGITAGGEHVSCDWTGRSAAAGEGQTAIGVEPLTRLSADWTGTGPGLKRSRT